MGLIRNIQRGGLEYTPGCQTCKGAQRARLTTGKRVAGRGSPPGPDSNRKAAPNSAEIGARGVDIALWVWV